MRADADLFNSLSAAGVAQESHLSLGQLKVMSVVQQCRTAALGRYVLRSAQSIRPPSPISE